MAQKLSRSKRKALGIRIKPKDGLWITYQLRLMGLKKKDMAARLGVCPQTVEQIINGRGSSRRIETALHETLGFSSFEAMIAAARGKGGNV
jgi:transcriptional regulator with XRE-family HTH domain